MTTKKVTAAAVDKKKGKEEVKDEWIKDDWEELEAQDEKDAEIDRDAEEIDKDAEDVPAQARRVAEMEAKAEREEKEGKKGGVSMKSRESQFAGSYLWTNTTFLEMHQFPLSISDYVTSSND